MQIVGAVASLLATAGAVPFSSTTTYTVSPHFAAGSLDALDVTITLRGDLSGKTVLDLPDHGMGQKERWKYISELHVFGATVQDDGPDKRILIARPNARITIRYQVRSAYSSAPQGKDGNPYAGAAILPTWFTTLGDFIFASPEGRDHAPAVFKWGAAPQNWVVASDLDPTFEARPLTVADVVNSNLMGGSDVKLYSRPIAGGVLRVAIRSHWAFPEQKLIDDIGTIVSAQRNFWSDADGPYFVSVVPMVTLPANISVGGTGRYRGFALYGTSNADEPLLRRIVAHEHIHNWIPEKVGEMPEGTAQPGYYWFSEGFTDFYTDRTLLRTGIWTSTDFVAHLNEVLREYDASPVQTAPNERIVSDFWTDPHVQKLAYERGYLLAFLWDKKMRRATEGRVGLDQIMFAMRDHFSGSAEGRRPDLIENFESTSQKITNMDVRPDIQRFAIDGHAITLPEDLFGRCAAVRTVTIPNYDVGFDPTASLKAGVFAGVDPKGPAYRAGLRNGMRRIIRTGGEPGDSRVEITYRVLDAAGAEHLIRYKPEGIGMISFQQVMVAPTAEPEAACVQELAGA